MKLSSAHISHIAKALEFAEKLKWPDEETRNEALWQQAMSRARERLTENLAWAKSQIIHPPGRPRVPFRKPAEAPSRSAIQGLAETIYIELDHEYAERKQRQFAALSDCVQEIRVSAEGFRDALPQKAHSFFRMDALDSPQKNRLSIEDWLKAWIQEAPEMIEQLKMLLRLAELSQQRKSGSGKQAEIGSITFNVKMRTLEISGENVTAKLSETTRQFLVALALSRKQSDDMPISKTAEIGNATAESARQMLRQQIGKLAAQIVRTEKNKGYRLAPAVQVAGDSYDVPGDVERITAARQDKTGTAQRQKKKLSDDPR